MRVRIHHKTAGEREQDREVDAMVVNLISHSRCSRFREAILAALDSGHKQVARSDDAQNIGRFPERGKHGNPDGDVRDVEDVPVSGERVGSVHEEQALLPERESETGALNVEDGGEADALTQYGEVEQEIADVSEEPKKIGHRRILACMLPAGHYSFDRMEQARRVVYATVAFAGALWVQANHVAYAQQVSQILSDNPLDRIEHHLEVHDQRIDNLDSRQSRVEGGTAIILVSLGVLNMLGFIRQPHQNVKNKEKEEGET